MIVISIIIFEVGNGSRHTLKRVPEMMDTSPIQKYLCFLFVYNLVKKYFIHLQIDCAKNEKPDLSSFSLTVAEDGT